MRHQFTRIRYNDLNSRQQEAFNLHKVAAVLADYGFITIPLSSDWGGADFIAQHKDGKVFLKVQLKGRLTFDKKYAGRDLHVCFRDGVHWFVYPHDELLALVLASGAIANTESWRGPGGYSFPRLSKKLRELLEPFRVAATD